MNPIDFPERNIVISENQPQYENLPAFINVDGEVVHCWELSYDDIEKLIKTRRIWVNQLTFNPETKNREHLQPILLSTDCPIIKCTGNAETCELCNVAKYFECPDPGRTGNQNTSPGPSVRPLTDEEE